MSLALRAEPRSAVDAAISRALDNLAALQEPRGSWAGDYGGPMFLLPMYVALYRLMARPIDARRTERMKTYFFNVQRADGSIGLHAEATTGSMFTTALSYVALRFLGVEPSDPRMQRMLQWVHSHGGPLGTASWGKFTLCLLGLYEWQGIHPLPPEMWLLPYEAPVHPGRLWCHCRQVYLPMAWLYANRSTGPIDPLIVQLRSELYDGKYDSIRWADERNTVSAADDYRPSPLPLDVANAALGKYERFALKPLRRRAINECLKHIVYEDRVTNDIDIGPVNAVLNKVVHHFRGAEGAADLERGLKALDVYLWDGHDGMKMQGYNNSELWDTAFALQAIEATGERSHPAMREKAYGFVRDNQILEDVPEPEAHYRHRCKGGWPFSNRAHGWPIADCTSEGLKVALALEGQFAPTIEPELLRESTRLLLSFQNDDGGWATYEKKRGADWLEKLNPSQVFGEIMVDYSYVECTSACVQGLAKAKARFPGELDREIDAALRGGDRFLRAQQRADGSFEGSWAVCFTYGTWFGVNGLLAVGASPSDPAIARACNFLLARQKPDGSWGEAGDSCRERRYLQHEKGQVVQTAWALLTLMRGGCDDRAALERAAEFLLARQEADGSWARESLVGVFSKTCLVNYDNYRHYFPLWALAEFRQRFRA